MLDGVSRCVLTTGRVANQWHTMTRTAKSAELLASEPEPFLELHRDDAHAAGVDDGEQVQVRSRHGHAVLRARISETVPAGTAFAPFHWGALHLKAGHGAINSVLPRALDPISKQAELKAAAIVVEPLSADVVAPPRDRTGQGRGRRRLLVVGTGMAAMETVERLLEHEDPHRWQITMVGREPDLPYNRMLLSKVVAGTASPRQLSLRPLAWLAERGIELRAGRHVAALDLSRSVAELEDGEELAFDRLVLATGSQQAIPAPLRPELGGVHPFRTLQDTRRIIEAARHAAHGVVIGGGLLGLELARGLKTHDVRVTVVHNAGVADGPAVGRDRRVAAAPLAAATRYRCPAVGVSRSAQG